MANVIKQKAMQKNDSFAQTSCLWNESTINLETRLRGEYITDFVKMHLRIMYLSWTPEQSPWPIRFFTFVLRWIWDSSTKTPSV